MRHLTLEAGRFDTIHARHHSRHSRPIWTWPHEGDKLPPCQDIEVLKNAIIPKNTYGKPTMVLLDLA